MASGFLGGMSGVAAAVVPLRRSPANIAAHRNSLVASGVLPYYELDARFRESPEGTNLL